VVDEGRSWRASLTSLRLAGDTGCLQRFERVLTTRREAQNPMITLDASTWRRQRGPEKARGSGDLSRGVSTDRGSYYRGDLPLHEGKLAVYAFIRTHRHAYHYLGNRCRFAYSLGGRRVPVDSPLCAVGEGPSARGGGGDDPITGSSRDGRPRTNCSGTRRNPVDDV